MCLVAEHMRAGGGGCSGRVCLCPFFHFFMATGGDCACEGCFDELGRESEEFLVCVFPYVVNDLLGGECWVCFGRVFDGAMDADLSDRLELVCIADDVADLGVVRAEDGREVERGTCKDRSVFGAV